MRIQKMLAEVGVASRRTIEEMIGEGRITVNGKLVVALPCFVEPDTDTIHVDGELVATATGPKRYFLLNKPKDVVCTSNDPRQRTRAIDCIPSIGDRVYCVGRLDADSTGLILLTNDGELTQHLTHPKYGVIKTYVALIDGQLTGEKVEQFKKGVWLDGRRTAGAMIRVLKRTPKSSLLQIRLTEGRNREIRRVLARLGHKVRRLHRSAIGPLTDRGMAVSDWRELSANEVEQLRTAGGFVSRKQPTRKTTVKKTGRATVKRAERATAKTTERAGVKKTKRATAKKTGRVKKASASRPPSKRPAAGRGAKPRPGAKKHTRKRGSTPKRSARRRR